MTIDVGLNNGEFRLIQIGLASEGGLGLETPILSSYPAQSPNGVRLVGKSRR
jgi:hypothetical protein